MNRLIKSDIQKLRKFAAALGGKVSIRKVSSRKGHDAGYYIYEDRTAVVFKGPKTSWKDIVLYLIHEISHMEGHYKFGNDALLKKAFKHVDRSVENWPRETRRAFYLLEKRDIKNMRSVWKRAKIESVSLKDVLGEEFYDIQVYQHYWKTGEHLSKAHRLALLTECKLLAKASTEGL